MRPDGFYWVRMRGHIEPAEWDSGRWTLLGSQQEWKDTAAIEVLAPCIMPSPGPEVLKTGL